MSNADDWKELLSTVVGVFAALVSLPLIAWVVYQSAENTQSAASTVWPY